MTKIIALILSLFMTATVAPALALSSDAVEKGYAAYNELTTAITIEMQQGWKKSPEEYGISDIFAYNSMSTFGYIWMDLDNDGVDELLLGEASVDGSDTPVYDMFCIKDNGELNHVLTGWERNRWYVIDSGLLLNEGSSGADDSFSCYYNYKNGTLTETEVDTTNGEPEPMKLDFTLFVDEPLVGGVGLANPWVETDEQGLVEETGFQFYPPKGAENIRYSYMKVEDGIYLVQMDFTLNGMEFTARMKDSIEFEDISGMYYDWTVTEDCEIDYCPGKTLRHIGEEGYVDVCLWFDVVPGVMYSLSTTGADLAGFDIEAVAREIFVPLQGDVG